MTDRTPTAQEKAVLAALIKASERVGMNAYKAGLYKVKRDRKGKIIQGYTLTPEHQEIQTAIDAFSRRKITAEEAMAILHQYEVFNARTKGY